MELKEGPIKLRGHHINLIRGYDWKYMFSSPSEEQFNPEYGKEYRKRYTELCNTILEGMTQIMLVDYYDDFCINCNCKSNNGCIHDGEIDLERIISRSDHIVANNFGMEIGKTYSGEDFLRRLYLRYNVRSRL